MSSKKLLKLCVRCYDSRQLFGEVFCAEKPEDNSTKMRWKCIFVLLSCGRAIGERVTFTEPPFQGGRE